MLTATVLICTYNRADLLGDTLDSIRTQRTDRAWDVLVVDNQSSDDTAKVVASRVAGYPVPLRYAFEPQQGKSHALNTGLSLTDRDVIVFTDDDVQVTQGWLDAACDPLERDPGLEYTGGPVRPLWGAEPPHWFDQEHPHLWGTLAILDYGRDPFVFEERRKVPLGVNMAVRRRLFDRIGGFHPAFGRTGTSLLGQEQAEFFIRTRAAGARGCYSPVMEVRHVVPAARLNKAYFRRWWYWKGISRSRLDRLHQQTETGLDLRHVPHVAGVPRYVWGALPRTAWAWLRAMVARDRQVAATHEMHVWYTFGYIRARLARRGSPIAAAPSGRATGHAPSVTGLSS
jgi:glucosyl-dolichyl phosphate glucuronosyltransferase